MANINKHIFFLDPKYDGELNINGVIKKKKKLASLSRMLGSTNFRYLTLQLDTLDLYYTEFNKYQLSDIKQIHLYNVTAIKDTSHKKLDLHKFGLEWTFAFTIYSTGLDQQQEYMEIKIKTWDEYKKWCKAFLSILRKDSLVPLLKVENHHNKELMEQFQNQLNYIKENHDKLLKGQNDDYIPKKDQQNSLQNENNNKNDNKFNPKLQKTNMSANSSSKSQLTDYAKQLEELQMQRTKLLQQQQSLEQDLKNSGNKNTGKIVPEDGISVSPKKKSQNKNRSLIQEPQPEDQKKLKQNPFNQNSPQKLKKDILSEKEKLQNSIQKSKKNEKQKEQQYNQQLNDTKQEQQYQQPKNYNDNIQQQKYENRQNMSKQLDKVTQVINRREKYMKNTDLGNDDCEIDDLDQYSKNKQPQEERQQQKMQINQNQDQVEQLVSTLGKLTDDKGERQQIIRTSSANKKKRQRAISSYVQSSSSSINNFWDQENADYNNQSGSQQQDNSNRNNNSNSVYKFSQDSESNNGQQTEQDDFLNSNRNRRTRQRRARGLSSNASDSTSNLIQNENQFPQDQQSQRQVQKVDVQEDMKNIKQNKTLLQKLKTQTASRESQFQNRIINNHTNRGGPIKAIDTNITQNSIIEPQQQQLEKQQPQSNNIQFYNRKNSTTFSNRKASSKKNMNNSYYGRINTEYNDNNDDSDDYVKSSQARVNTEYNDYNDQDDYNAINKNRSNVRHIDLGDNSGSYMKNSFRNSSKKRQSSLHRRNKTNASYQL